jgi:hypothetical protein
MKNYLYALFTLAALAVFSVCCLEGATVLGTMAMGGIAVGMTMQLKDSDLQETLALPNGAATTAQSTGFDLGNGTDLASHGGVCELLIEAPALTTAELPDAETMTYDVYHDDSSDFSGETLLHSAALVQTGAGGAGDAAASKRVGIPSDVKRYLRIKATNSGAGDASGSDATSSLVF